MKVLLRIFIPLCVVSFIAFGISVAIFGTNQDASPAGDFRATSYTISDEYTKIDADIGAYYLDIQPNSGNNTDVYIAGTERNVDKIRVEVIGSTLHVSVDPSAYGFGSWTDWLRGFSGYPTVNIKVPDKVYEKLNVGVSSGTADVRGVSASDVSLATFSGDISYTQNCITDSLTISTTSGSIGVKNAATKSYNIRATSGNIDVDGLTGTGSVKATSGNLTIRFAELTSYCDVSVTSGDVTLVVPDNTNANINCKKTSGDIVISACGVYRDVGEKETVLLGRGGVTMDVRATSGDIMITDDPDHSAGAAYSITSAQDTGIIVGEARSEVGAAFDEVRDEVGTAFDEARSEVSAALSEAAGDISDAFDF